jgi:hypothetical protein
MTDDRAKLDTVLRESERAVLAAAVEFEREHNTLAWSLVSWDQLPLPAKDLALAARRRQELYDAVRVYREVIGWGEER